MFSKERGVSSPDAEAKVSEAEPRGSKKPVFAVHPSRVSLADKREEKFSKTEYKRPSYEEEDSGHKSEKVTARRQQMEPLSPPRRSCLPEEEKADSGFVEIAE